MLWFLDDFAPLKGIKTVFDSGFHAVDFGFPSLSVELGFQISIVRGIPDSLSCIPAVAIGKKKPEKNQGFNRIRTRDLRDTGAMLYQLSYEATHWERGQLIEFTYSCE